MLIQMFFAVTLQILHCYLLLLRICLIYAYNMQRLHYRFGSKGKVLDWFRSYLENRTQFVKIGDTVFVTHPLDCEVLQGSVLGPLLYLL